MRMWAQSHLCQKQRHVISVLAAAFACMFLVLCASQSASALPAFARKYGLRCSACHESWPALNNFGLKFRDNGYQLMNDRDAPIWQNPGYWPITFRITPIWHLSLIHISRCYSALTRPTPRLQSSNMRSRKIWRKRRSRC